MKPLTHRPRGLSLIIAYKFAKAPLMLALAILLTADPGGALHLASALAHDLSDGGAMLGRVGAWLERHLSDRYVTGAAALAWIDAASTAVEGVLLLQGHAWGTWIVVAILAAFLPVEALALGRHPSLLKLIVLALNAGVVAYLVHLRLSPK